MKKFVIVLMVLGIVSAANAAMTWSTDAITLNTGQTTVLQISSSSTDAYDIKVDKVSLVTVTDAAARDAAGDDSSATQMTGDYAGWWQLVASDLLPETPPNISAGVHWDVTITAGSSTGTATLWADYFSYGGNPADDLGITVVPEPITVALLGLGGLFLRRRK